MGMGCRWGWRPSQRRKALSGVEPAAGVHRVLRHREVGVGAPSLAQSGGGRERDAGL